MFNIIKHCEYERAKNNVEYKRIKTSTNDPTITRRKRFSELMKSSKTYITITITITTITTTITTYIITTTAITITIIKKMRFINER